ncbi:hypothetical protein [Dactylosporangium sp. CA-092794]|uniref:hypothetical protein n=1 Tax=Dactylosporangium sp. CA-092794 TaxID=3239929 RepID=UPI003D8DD427
MTGPDNPLGIDWAPPALAADPLVRLRHLEERVAALEAAVGDLAGLLERAEERAELIGRALSRLHP